MLYQYVVVFVLISLIPLLSHAQRYSSGLRTGEQSFKSESIPMEGDIEDVLLELEYTEGAIPRVLKIDLNND